MGKDVQTLDSWIFTKVPTYLTAAFCGSFPPEMVLLPSTDGLEPSSWGTWLPAALRMEKLLFELQSALKHESEGGETREALVAPPR